MRSGGFLFGFSGCLRGKNKKGVCLFMGTDPGLSPCRKNMFHVRPLRVNDKGVCIFGAYGGFVDE
jgi:hypothetical protein